MLVFFFLEEYRKKQKKSHLDSNLKYFLGSSYKMQESCSKKVLEILYLNRGVVEMNWIYCLAKKVYI